MTPNRGQFAAVLVAGALGVALLGGAGATGAARADGHAGVQSHFPSSGVALSADETLMMVDLRPDGTAVWRVEFRYRFDDEETEEAFETVRQDVARNPLNYSGRFAADMERAATVAGRDTGREMAIHNVSVNATQRPVPETHGVLVYTFEWEGFAATNGGRLRASGALSGMTLEEHQALLVSWPADYRLVEATPVPTDEREDEVVWRGPEVFGGSGLTVVVESTGGSPGVDVPATPVALAVGAAGLAVGVAIIRRRRGGTSATEGTTAPDPDLLSDEERVLRLLEDHGGRMKQQDVVEAVDWSETKTSEVVQSLQEADRVEVYRIGRENVLALPGEMDL